MRARTRVVMMLAAAITLLVGVMISSPRKALAETYEVDVNAPYGMTIYYLDASGNHTLDSLMPIYLPDTAGNTYHCIEPHKDFLAGTHASADATTVLPQSVINKLGLSAMWCKTAGNVPADRAEIVEQTFMWKILGEIGFGADGVTVDYVTEGYDSNEAYARFMAWYNVNKNDYVGHGVVLTSTANGNAQRVGRFWAVRDSGGKLTVRKQASSNASEAMPAFSFAITFSGSGAPEPVSFNLANGESRTIEHIPTGVTATVTESTTSEWAQDWSPSNAVVIQSGGDHVITCTNTRKTGELRMRKAATGPGIPADKTWPFRVTIRDNSGAAWRTETFNLGNGGEKVMGGIPTGYTYMVEETLDAADAADYAVTGVPASGTIGEGSVTVTGTNVRKTGELKVRKVATGPGIPAGKTWPFKVTIRDESGAVWHTETFDLGNGGEKAMGGIPTGYTYMVEETLGVADAARYVVTGVPVSGSISGGTVTVTGSNARRTGNFEVSKVVDRSRIDDQGLDANRTFDIVVQLKDESGNAVSGTYGDMTFTNGSCRLTLKDGDVRRAIGVPTEYSWVVSEPSVPGGYELSGITNATGSITADKTVRSVVTNAQQPGWARVTKVTR